MYLIFDKLLSRKTVGVTEVKDEDSSEYRPAQCRDWNRFYQNRINRKSNRIDLIENCQKKSNLA